MTLTDTIFIYSKSSHNVWIENNFIYDGRYGIVLETVSKYVVKSNLVMKIWLNVEDPPGF